MGSGGGGAGAGTAAGGAGGGYLKLVIDGLTILNGVLQVNGDVGVSTNVRGGGGGAGGSLKLVTTSISGTGTMSANGGGGGSNGNDSVAGGGSGGRIRFVSDNKFIGIIEARGGNNVLKPFTVGGDGTYSQNIASGYCDTMTGGTCVISTRTSMGTGEILDVTGNLTLTSANYSLVSAANNQLTDRLQPPTGFSVKVTGILTVDTGHTWIPSTYDLFALDVLKSVEANEIIINGEMRGNFPLIFAKNITVGSSGKINANGWGWQGSKNSSLASGPFPGPSDGSGGGHCGAGGSGATISGETDVYKSAYGSGGRGATGVTGGNGGGRIKIVARGTLSITTGGIVSADGMDSTSSGNAAGGGGAGGLVIIDAGLVLNSGSIQV